jgi:hypothetical protein
MPSVLILAEACQRAQQLLDAAVALPAASSYDEDARTQVSERLAEELRVVIRSQIAFEVVGPVIRVLELVGALQLHPDSDREIWYASPFGGIGYAAYVRLLTILRLLDLETLHYKAVLGERVNNGEPPGRYVREGVPDFISREIDRRQTDVMASSCYADCNQGIYRALLGTQMLYRLFPPQSERQQQPL